MRGWACCWREREREQHREGYELPSLARLWEGPIGVRGTGPAYHVLLLEGAGLH